MALIRPVCTKCKLEFRVKSNSGAVVELAGTPPKPYQIYLADIWVCLGCGAEIAGGMPPRAIAQHHEPSFKGVLDKIKRDIPYVILCYERVEDAKK